MAIQKPAPKFLNLLHINLPPGGIASIGHRISGVVMFLAVPVIAYWFGMSLENPEGFASVRETLASLPVLLISVLLVWSLSHHLFTGFRHLLLDIEVGVDKIPARISAWIVNIGAVAVTLIYLASLL